MSINMSVRFTFRTPEEDITFEKIIEHFSFLVKESGNLLSEQKEWFETGSSKINALKNIAFKNNEVSEHTLLKWMRGYKKDAPLFAGSVWDGKGDITNSITYRKIYFHQKNSVDVDLHFVSQSESVNLNEVIALLKRIACYFDCSYINAADNGYTFFKNNVFPDRLSVGWMLYIPHIVLPELIPEAARVVAVMEGDKQKGTIVVSTEEIFDGSNKEHIAKSNDIEIKLLDLGLLPLYTEL